MSRKDYLAFARILAGEMQVLRESYAALPCRYNDILTGKKLLLLTVAHAMCETFEADNPNFDEDRFMGACGFNYKVDWASPDKRHAWCV